LFYRVVSPRKRHLEGVNPRVCCGRKIASELEETHEKEHRLEPQDLSGFTGRRSSRGTQNEGARSVTAERKKGNAQND